MDTARIKPKRYETDITVGDFEGLNTFGPHSMIAPNQLRDMNNYDLFPGYMKSRRGSINLQSTAQKLSSKDVANGVKWAIGTSEYVIAQLISGSTTEFWWAKILPTQTAFVQVLNFAAANLTTSTNDPADMVVSGNRLYIFHPSGNLILEWNGSAFIGRPMGLQKCYLLSLAGTGSSTLSGRYTVGVEFVYQSGGVDIVNSSPNRKTFAGKQLSITVINQNILVAIDGANIPIAPKDYWTHVRIWRSKRQDTDYTDPLNPIDAAGLDSELYPEQLITKAAILGAGGLATLTKLDSELPGDPTSEYPVLTFTNLELSPLPAGYIGTYHRNRMWVSRAQGVNDTTQSAIYYSNSAGDAYAEQYDSLNSILRAERGDGQQCVKIISFESDLLILKEAKTMRIPNGDVDAGIEVIDANIGVTNYRLAQYVPKVGICAIVNDQSEFRVFGYNLRWTNLYQGVEISRTIRAQTLAMATAPAYVSFGYINGKLLVSDGTGVMYALNAKEGKGWGKYTYGMNGVAQLLLTFSKGSRALVISKNTYMVEIEKEGLDTDISTASDTAASISLSYTLARFQSGAGRDILEMHHYSQVALLSNNLNATPYINGDFWPQKTVANNYNFVPDYSAYAPSDNGLEREYRFFMDAASPMRGQFIHYAITTTAPATIRDGRLRCVIDDVGMGLGVFDPFATLSTGAYTPDWIDLNTLDAGAGVRDLSQFTTYDGIDGVRTLGSMETLDRG